MNLRMIVAFGLLVMQKPQGLLAVAEAEVQTNAVAKDGFSISPPPDWKVLKDFKGSSFYFEEPIASNPEETPRSMEVRSFNQGIAIDENGLETMAKTLEQTYAQQLLGYKVSASEIINLKSGLKAMLFYTSYWVGEQAMMQMHIVVSAQDRHFVMSYSDFAATIQDTSHPIFNLVYSSMGSALLDNPVQTGLDKEFLYFAAGLGALGLGGLLMWFLKPKNEWDQYEEDGENEDGYAGTEEGQNPKTRMPVDTERGPLKLVDNDGDDDEDELLDEELDFKNEPESDEDAEDLKKAS